MTKEETKKAIEVMQAWVDGKKIEYRYKGEPEWITVALLTSWDWKNWDYRIKPEPMEIEVWVNGTRVSTYTQPNMGPEWTKKRFREVIE